MGSRVLFDPSSPVFRVHEGGKLAMRSKIALTDRESLSLAYTARCGAGVQRDRR